MTFLNPYTKALLCENARLEEIMNIPISEILDYKSRADSVNPEDALRYLADMYVDNCGISRGLRVFADYCAQFWVERLTAQQNNMNDAESNVSFFDLLSKFSAKYTSYIDKYDSCPLTSLQLRDFLLKELQNTENETEKTILCAGILPCLLYDYNGNWLSYIGADCIEDGIVNLEDRTLIEFRSHRNLEEYRPTRNLENKIIRQAKVFSNDEINHFVKLNNRLVELQKEVMAQVEAIKQNLDEQISKGFHQYDTFFAEGFIYIESPLYIEGLLEESVQWSDNNRDRLLEALIDSCPHYSVCLTNEDLDLESLKESNSQENNWYANWSGIFHQLEEIHGIKLCRSFRVLFDDSNTFTIPDILKIQPEWFLSQVKIFI